MKQYLDNLEKIIDQGTWQENRTGVKAITLPGTSMSFDLQEGFPLLTTKKMATKALVGELIGFLRGYDNAADFRRLSCNIWNANANDPGKPGSRNAWLDSLYRTGDDHLGRIYGVQWRQRRDLKIVFSQVESIHLENSGYSLLARSCDGDIYGREFDQVMDVIDRIKNNPTDRRMIIEAWNPAEFDEMALPPCHVLYQFLVNVERGELNLCMYQRSCDYFLGVPFNIASASLFLAIMAKITGLKPRFFNHFLADSHIYENALDAVVEQVKRDPLPLCSLDIDDSGWDHNSSDIFQSIIPGDFNFENYNHHAAITGVAMAV